MTPREQAIDLARRVFGGDYVDRVALGPCDVRDAADMLRQLLAVGGYRAAGIRVDYEPGGIRYDIGGESGRVTYLELARVIRGGQQPEQLTIRGGAA